MSDKKKAALHPDRITLEELNGHIFINIVFNNEQEDTLIQIDSSEAEYLLNELNVMQEKILIASEYAE